ncbi:hypothetical protein [Hallella sp.]|uniref:hypothetical protein n=1 Tax=Hallella sp. TaxID=2980186 RepID=UPI00284D851F|nr:hypothetical protein [Hallella sp.]MDR3844433.1 hypothetical protein [Hallella sp.]
MVDRKAIDLCRAEKIGVKGELLSILEAPVCERIAQNNRKICVFGKYDVILHPQIVASCPFA